MRCSDNMFIAEVILNNMTQSYYINYCMQIFNAFILRCTAPLTENDIFF